MKVSNWGNYPVIEAGESSFAGEREAKSLLPEGGEVIPRGLGRCYGDSALAPRLLSSVRNNRMLNFDEEAGVLTCESGVSLAAILDTFVPRGWFPHVTPGTKFITVGGAIASDIHGKNHHSEGSFSRHLLSFRLLTGTGAVLHCSREENTELFWATCGGQGLTGLILEATFKLKRIETSFLKQKVLKARNLDELVGFFETNMHWTYSVAWIDLLAGGKSMGRSVLNLGDFATREELGSMGPGKNPLALHKPGKLTVPFFLPNFTLNPLTARAFNFVWYHKNFKREKTSFVHYDPFFYPLDAIHHWNRGYGKRGFTQYQFVLPPANGLEGLTTILDMIRKSGIASPLTVLKWFGKGDPGWLSFPREGWTLALDFPISKKLFPFLKKLDEVVLAAGGRLYLTKDVRMDEAMFKAGYPRWEEFVALRKKLDPKGIFASAQARRVGLV